MNLKNIAAFAVGPLGAALLSFITLPILAWFYNADDIGRFSMLQVVISFSIVLFALGLDQAYVREYHEDSNKALLLKHTMLPGLLLLFIITSALMLEPHFIASILFASEDTIFSLLACLCVAAAFFIRFLSLILRMQDKGLAFSMSQLLPKLIFLIIISSYINFVDIYNFQQLLIAHTVSLLLVCLFYLWKTKTEWLTSFQHPINKKRMQFLISYSLPMIAASLAFWGLTAMDKILLRSIANFKELGVYSIAVSFAAAASILQAIFSTLWSPMIYRWSASNINHKKIINLIKYVLCAVLILFSLAGLFSWVVSYILPNEYHQVESLFIACMSYPLLYALSEATKIGIGISRKTIYSMTAAIVAFAINLIGNYLLIPKYGASGAAISTAAAFWIFFVCRTEFSIRLWHHMPRALLYIPTLIWVIISIIYVIFGDLLKVYFIGFSIFSLLCALFLAFRLYKKSLKSV